MHYQRIEKNQTRHKMLVKIPVKGDNQASPSGGKFFDRGALRALSPFSTHLLAATYYPSHFRLATSNPHIDVALVFSRYYLLYPNHIKPVPSFHRLTHECAAVISNFPASSHRRRASTLSVSQAAMRKDRTFKGLQTASSGR